MANRVLLFLGLVFVALVLAWVLVPPEAPTGLSRGAVAPDFTADTVDGQSFRLKDLRGKIVILDFWATWCVPCLSMIPDERELVKKMRDKPVALVGISADSDVGKLRRFVSSHEMGWTHVVDGPEGPIQQRYEVGSLPTIYVLDARGTIRFAGMGAQPAGKIERWVEQLLEEGH
jgi:peroxiredoxin